MVFGGVECGHADEIGKPAVSRRCCGFDPFALRCRQTDIDGAISGSDWHRLLTDLERLAIEAMARRPVEFCALVPNGRMIAVCERKGASLTDFAPIFRALQANVSKYEVSPVLYGVWRQNVGGIGCVHFYPPV